MDFIDLPFLESVHFDLAELASFNIFECSILVTATMGSVTELEYQVNTSKQPIQEPLVLVPSGDTKDRSPKQPPSRVDVATTTEVPVKSKEDRYGYQNRKKTVINPFLKSSLSRTNVLGLQGT